MTSRLGVYPVEVGPLLFLLAPGCHIIYVMAHPSLPKSAFIKIVSVYYPDHAAQSVALDPVLDWDDIE
jgi:hypothetical protein